MSKKKTNFEVTTGEADPPQKPPPSGRHGPPGIVFSDKDTWLSARPAPLLSSGRRIHDRRRGSRHRAEKAGERERNEPQRGSLEAKMGTKSGLDADLGGLQRSVWAKRGLSPKMEAKSEKIKNLGGPLMRLFEIKKP